ncbi:calponin homology (CH) domain-containing protein [Ditylenchus destructor]|nr:calponin homology (CH) domain-containing protein [Ditylenchus destructor]
MLNKEQLADLSEQFPTLNENASGHLAHSDVHAALKVVGIDIPGYQLRELLNNYGDSKNLTFEQFNTLFEQLDNEKNAEASRWKKRIGSVTGAYQVQSTAVHGAEEIVHTIRVEEEVAFSNWINTSLSADPDLSNQMPVNPEGGDLYAKIHDGLIICKLINLAVPETIDTRCINKKNLNTYTKLENLTLCLMSAQAIGCNIVNIDADDLLKGKPHLILGLLWQIIRIGLFREIDLIHVPGLFRLLNEGETLDDFRKLSPEQILIRWVNYHLKNSGTDRRLSNFTSDVTDSEIYTYLINEIAPKEAGTTLKPLTLQGDVPRANALLREADKIGCREFVTAEDIAKGNYKLNLAFVANLFNKYPALPELDADEIPEIDGIEETPEEKTYRNWMNSLGVDPYVNYLYSDLQNGIVIFQLYDAIRPGIVNWKRVVRHFRKLQSMMDQIQNCNYAVELGKQLRFSLVGIQGKDIYDANPTLTLALVWQLMRAYTLTILAQCTQSGESLATDKEIVAWVNEKLQSAGKSGRIKSFQDPTISNAKVVIDLIDAISPGAINYELVQSGGPQSSLENAKYAITSGRKLGAKIYATPEDIVEVRPKMVMTAFACLMARDAYLALNMRKITNGNGN